MILILLAGVALALVAALWLRKGGGALLGALSLAGLILAALQIGQSAAPHGPPPALMISESAGVRLGREVASIFPKGGELLVLQDRCSAEARVVADQELAGLRAGLGVGAFSLVTAGRSDEGGAQPARMESVSAAAFAGWVRSRTGAVAVVSFIGIPAGTTETDLRGAPPLYALFYGGYDHWAPLMKAGRVAGVVVPERCAARLARADHRPAARALDKLGYRYVGRAGLDAAP